MSQSCSCSLFLAKTNEKDACLRVPQSSSLPQSCAKEKSSGVEIDREHRGKTYAHALTSALPVCRCGSVAQINLVVAFAVCQLVVANQQPQMKEKRTKKKVCRR